MVLAKRNPQCLNQIHVLKPIINLLGAEFEESSYELLHQMWEINIITDDMKKLDLFFKMFIDCDCPWISSS